MSAAALVTSNTSDHISPRNFERLAGYIYSYSGIKMPATKRTMLEGRLRRRLRATRISSFDAYCDFLFDQKGLDGEAMHLINAVTTNKTDFFREPAHFDFLRDKALPALAADGAQRIRAWSAACSTGAEPYTLAMVLEEFAARAPALSYSILATDLSTEVLDVARRGVFADELLQVVPPDLRTKYVMPAKDSATRRSRISPALRARIGFARFNLMDRSYPIDEPLDLIFCRNVLIYFDKTTQGHVLSQLCERLRPGGFLFLGHSESITGHDLPLRQVANTVFVRR